MIPPPAGEDQPKVSPEYTADQKEGIPGEEVGDPGAPLLLQSQTQDPSREAQKAMQPEQSAQNTSFCLAPNFNLFPQASTQGA